MKKGSKTKIKKQGRKVTKKKRERMKGMKAERKKENRRMTKKKRIINP